MAFEQKYKMKWRSDFDKQCVVHNFEKRGWMKATSDGKVH